MSKKRSLRQRILISNLLLTLITSSLFVIIFFIAEQYTESHLFDRQIDSEVERFINNKKTGQDVTPAPGINIHYGDDIPLRFLELKPSSSTYEVIYEGAEYAVRVYLIEAQRYVVVQDRRVFETVEFMVLISLVFASVMGIFLSYFFSKLLSNKVIRPLINLSKFVSSDIEQYKYQIDSKDEVEVLARAINERNERLSGFVKREKLFTGDVSHELRTPLTIILGAAEVLQVKLKNEADLIGYADRIRNTALATSQRMTALFLLSRSPESIDAPATPLYEVVESEINSSLHLLKNKPVTCSLKGDKAALIHARPELAAIAIGNLIRNAFQYTEKGQVTVSLSQNSLVIEDTGLGIPENIRVILFERYVHGSDNDQPGSGLGLSIVKRVCDHLGWVISYQHQVSGGSRFTIEFDS